MLKNLLPAAVEAALSKEQSRQGNVWLVGGALRDHFLERDTVDFDFAVDGPARRLARRVADRLGAAYFDLDQDRDTGRVIAEDASGGWQSLDFAGLRAETIQEDLELRDFSVNALAASLVEDQLLDPTGGLADLRSGVLRLCRSDGLERDPVRAVRAVRLSAELGFQLDPALVKKIHAIAPAVGKSSIERVRHEFFGLLALARPAMGLRVAVQLKLAGLLLPRLNEEQLRAGFVRLDHLSRLTAAIVGEHRDEATADWVTGQASVRIGRFRSALAEDLGQEIAGGRTRHQLLNWSALYVPEGFPPDKVRQLLEAWHLSRLELSNAMKLAQAWQQWQGAPLSAAENKRERYRYFDKLDETGVEMALLALADKLTEQAGPPGQTVWEETVEKARDLLMAWYEGPPQDLDPIPLLRGDELMEYLGLPAGPIIGDILGAIREEQAAGAISDRQEALKFSEQYYFEHA